MSRGTGMYVLVRALNKSFSFSGREFPILYTNNFVPTWDDTVLFQCVSAWL